MGRFESPGFLHGLQHADYIACHCPCLLQFPYHILSTVAPSFVDAVDRFIPRSTSVAPPGPVRGQRMAGLRNHRYRHHIHGKPLLRIETGRQLRVPRSPVVPCCALGHTSIVPSILSSNVRGLPLNRRDLHPVVLHGVRPGTQASGRWLLPFSLAVWKSASFSTTLMVCSCFRSNGTARCTKAPLGILAVVG